LREGFFSQRNWPEHRGRETRPVASVVLARQLALKKDAAVGSSYLRHSLQISALFILEARTSISYPNIYPKEVNIYLNGCLLLYVI